MDINALDAPAGAMKRFIVARDVPYEAPCFRATLAQRREIGVRHDDPLRHVEADDDNGPIGTEYDIGRARIAVHIRFRRGRDIA